MKRIIRWILLTAVKELNDAYMKGRKIQLTEMKKQTKALERIADAVEKCTSQKVKRK